MGFLSSLFGGSESKTRASSAQQSQAQSASQSQSQAQSTQQSTQQSTGQSAGQSFNFGYSGPAEFTSQQLQLQDLAALQGTAQLNNLLKAAGYSDDLINAAAEGTPSQLGTIGQDLASGVTQQSIDRQGQLDQLFQSEVDRINQGPTATPEQQELIDDIARNRIASTQSDINAALKDSLGLIRSELAPSRGLRPEDTPIQDRGQVLARESLRLSDKAINEAYAQRAQNLLDYPLQASQLASQQTGQAQQYGLNEANLSLALQQFQNQLQSEDFARNLAAGNYGLQLAGIAPSNVGQFAPPGSVSVNVGGSEQQSTSQSSGQSSGQSTSNASSTSAYDASSSGTSSSRGSSSSSQGILNSAFGQGLGMAIGLSSRKIKENNRPVNYMELLEKFKEFDVERWNYTYDKLKDDYIGPYAEDMKKLFEVGTDNNINFINMNGITMAAIKALLVRVETLERLVDGNQSESWQ